MTIIKTLIRFILSIVIAVMMLFAFLLTPYGFQSTLFIVKMVLPGRLHYEQINGLLIGPIHITHFDYQHKSQHIHIRNLDFNWSPINLLQGELTINHLIADDVTVIVPHSNISDDHSLTSIFNNIRPFKPTPLHLPLLLRINQAHITNMTYGQIHTPVTTIKNMTINGVIHPDHLDFSAYAHFLKPAPVKIIFAITGDLNNYKILTHIINNHNQITLNAIGNQHAMTLTLPNEQLENGHIKANATFTWYPVVTCNATWLLNIPDLSHINNNMRGTILSDGSIHGNLAAPEISGALTLKNAAIENITASSLHMNWFLLFDSNNTSNLKTTGTEVSYNGKKVHDLDIDISGQLKNHLLNASVNLNKNALTLTGNAHYDEMSWQGSITQLKITHDTFGEWTLKNTAPFFYSPAQIYLKPLCVTASTGAFICMQLQEKQKKPWNFSLNGQNISLANVRHSIVSRVQFTGKLSFNAKAIGIGQAIQYATLKSDLTSGILTYNINNQFKDLNIYGLHINTTVDKKNGLQGIATLSLEKNSSLTASLSMPQLIDEHIPFDDKKITGNLSINMSNIQSEFLITSVLKTTLNKIVGKILINGTLAHPKLQGTATIKASSFEYTAAQMFVHNITATIDASNNKLLYNLSSHAFNNSLVTLTGNTIFNLPNITTTLILKTNNAEVAKNNDFDLFATSIVTFVFDPKQLAITGNIFVPKALLSPTSFENTLTMPKENVVYIGLPPSTKVESPYKRTVNLSITLGNNVLLDTHNMKAALLGSLNLSMSPQKVTLANGRIHLTQGTFTAYGKTLKLAAGSAISFTHSPINNPTINAHAFKYVTANSQTAGSEAVENTILVGIYIHGALNNLQLSLYSQPPNIPQADILSYLVLGYASSGTNPSSLSALLTAASTASSASGGLTQSSNFINEIKQGLGIQEGDIGTRNETILDAIGNPIQTQSAFVVSHRISNKIYVEYSRGTIIPDNTVAVRYKINKNWSIQTTAGSGPTTGTGGDVMYSFSRN